MTQDRIITSEIPQPRDAWDTLSMKEKAEMIGVAVRNGITSLKDIRQKYNEFAEGGDTNPYTVGATVDALYGSNPREEYLGEPSHHYDFTQSEEWSNAHGYYPDARGHRDDRVKKISHPSHPSRGTWNGDKFELTDLGMQNPNYTLFGLTDGGQDPQAVLTYQGGIVLPEVTVTPNENYFYNPYDNIILHQKANGGKIHIKPSHRGRLTELKERTGKTEAELYRTGGPSVRKMITFARNARKWKHGLGGNLFDGTSQDSQQMDIAIPDATYVASTPLFHPISRKEYDWEDAALHRTNQVYSNYDEAKDEPLSLGNTLFRNGLRWIKDNIYEDFPSGVSNCTLSATQWVDPQTPVKGAKSIHMNPERFNYTAIDSAEVVPGNLIISKVPDKDSYHTMMVTGFAGQDSTVNFRGKNYSVKKGEPLMTYSRGGHDASFIQRNMPLSVYTANSDGHTQNLFYRYNYPREVFLPEIIITPNKKKK